MLFDLIALLHLTMRLFCLAMSRQGKRSLITTYSMGSYVIICSDFFANDLCDGDESS